MIAELLFWLLLGSVLYSYFGYSLVLLLMALPKRLRGGERPQPGQLPEATLVIAAYNEASQIPEKVSNTQALRYPPHRLRQLWVTDGSSDDSPQMLRALGIEVIHSQHRLGKTAALNRAMPLVQTPITILCDANTMLSPDALIHLAQEFADPSVGGVAGEKRIILGDYGNAVNSGEGLYWQYESCIKRMESSLGSVLCAAGELYAIRTELFQPVSPDTILDDFAISSAIIQRGYRFLYAPNAIAAEHSSASIAEEKKRKVRIAAGAFQFLSRNRHLLNPFANPLVAFQFISHKAIRWALAPPAMLLLPLLNAVILIQRPGSALYQATAGLMLGAALLVALGWLLRERYIRWRFLFVPYYIFTMNLSVIQGFIKFLRGLQDVRWEKAKRSQG